MKGWKYSFLLLISFLLLPLYGAQKSEDANGKPAKKIENSFKSRPYNPDKDLAFVSVWGNRPKINLRGFQRAVLYNAQGALLREIDLNRSDSVYSLDKMLQENRTKGPLFIKMIK